MSVGRGATGLLSNERTFADLIDDSAADRQQLLDLYPGKVAAGPWTLGSSSTYSMAFHEVFGGRLLDVMAVETMVEPRPLVRVEDLVSCQATAGTYFYDYDAAIPVIGPAWDDGLSMWDSGLIWDAFPTWTSGVLYVHLPDGSHPANTTVVALLGLHVAGKGETLPVLDTDRLTDGPLDLWTTSTNLTNWTETADVSQDTPLVGTGSSVKVSGSIPAATFRGVSQGTLKAAVGAHYFFSGTYRTKVDNPADLHARIRVQNTSGQYMRADGRETDGSTAGLTLANTHGEVRRFLFVFRCPFPTVTLEVMVGAYNATGGGGAITGTVNFDALKLQRVWSYQCYEPRLGDSSVPETEVASLGIAFGEKTMGLGQAAILIGDGAWDRAAAMLWENKSAVFEIGGAFQDGQRLGRDDHRPQFSAIIRKTLWEREQLALDLSDAWGFLRIQCPPNTYTLSDHPNMNLNDEGYVRPMLWGVFGVSGPAELHRPVRIDQSSTTGYGTYEVADPTVGVNGVRQSNTIYVFPTEEDAQRGTRGMGLTVTDHFTWDLANCRFTIVTDPRNLRYDDGGADVGMGLSFDFDIGGGALVATVDVEGPISGGSFSAVALLQAAMRTASGAGDINVTYSDTTHLVTVSKGAGTLNLNMKTGANDQQGAWRIFGYDLDTDRTGLLSYTADRALFSDAESNHIIRMAPYGYRDDASGTITGELTTPQLETGRNVVYHVLLEVAKRPPAKLHALSLRQFQTGNLLNVALWEPSTVGEVIADIERTEFVDVVIDGSGVISYRPLADAVVVEEFFERDYVSLAFERDVESIYSVVRLLYGPNPHLRQFRNNDYVDDAGVPVKYGRDDVLTVKTFHRPAFTGFPGAAIDGAGEAYARLYSAAPLIATFSAQSKLVDLLIGDKVRLTCSRAPTSSGVLNGAVFRIRKLRHNYINGVSTCVAVEDVPFLFG